MPPRRSQPRQAVAETAIGSSSGQIPQLDELTSQLENAIALWDEFGQEVLQGIVSSRLDDALGASPLSSLPLSHIFMTLLRSTLDAVQVTSLISSVIDAAPEEDKENRIECLGEALVDAVEVMEQEREDRADLGTSKEMQVDGGKAPEVRPGEKGIQAVKHLIESSHLPQHIPNLLFSPDILLKLSFHPYPGNPQALQRAYIKRNTTLFFKQSKYNLLRESSEGFSALVVLLTCHDSLSPSVREESGDARKIRAKRLWDKVMALIGYFNLSPPRVLDLMLEVASCQVAPHWKFFLELLKCSPWGRAVQEAGKGKGKERAGGNWLEDEATGIESALDAGGDRVLSQVLGVKFGFYQRQDGGDTPHGLVYMAALLVRHGYVSLSDLLPFLSPDDTQMEKIHNAYLRSVSSRSGPSNALSNSVLVDDEPPTSAASKADDAGPPPKAPPEQRILLLQALLAIGDLPSSMFFLARFPWVAQSHPPIADLIMRIVAFALEDVYRSVVVRQFGDVGEDELDFTAQAPFFGTRSEREIVSTILAPAPPTTPSKEFEFFYSDWANSLERWSSSRDIFDKGLRWLSLVRGLAGRDIPVMVKICRIGAAEFAALRKVKELEQGLQHDAKTKDEIRLVEPTSEEMKPWLDLIRISLLPALSASGATAAFDVELWHLLKYFPYLVRYALYGEWRDSTCRPMGRNPCPVAAHAAAESTRDIKKALSRVTAAQSAPGGGQAAATDRGPARALAKLSHTNPHALWMTAVTQVKAYPNIGQFIVEAGRYMTQLSTDVAMFTLVDTLSDDTVSRLNPNGTDVAQWLASLATFVGDFNRRYASMDLEPVLQFIINRLMRSESADLTILDKLISIMSGVSQVENDAISEEQLQAYAAGKEMVREAFHSTIIAIAKPPEGVEIGAKAKEAPVDKAKSTKKSLPRLVNALRDTKLAMPIWIALAQTRQEAVDKMASAPIKAMAATQDTVHGTFIQYGELLAEQLTPDEHILSTPDLASLVSDFGLDFAMAFQILRPHLNAELDRVKARKEAAMRLKIAAAKEEGVRIMSPSKDSTPLPSPISPSMQLENEDGDVAMGGVNGDAGQNGVSIPGPKLSATVKSWYPSSLRTAMEHARELLPSEANTSMGAPFFVIFWHLTMADIAFSPESYDKAIAKINSMERDVASWRTTAVTDQKAERARLKARAEQLTKEKEVHGSSVTLTRRRLLRESKHWFGNFILEKNLQRKLSYQLHQHCFFPRAILTPADAVFVAKFIRMAHDLGTIGFSTLFVYTNFFGDHLAGCIFSCTTNEARNLGRCLGTMMADLDAWHQDEKRYRTEALGLDRAEGNEGKELPGMMFRSKKQAPLGAMSWQQFREFYAKAHNALAKALVSCWAETDFMHIKNAITVGLQVIKYFPIMDTNGKDVENAVKDLVAGKNGTLTPDVQHQCQAYLRLLTQRQNTRSLIPPSSFHLSGQKPAAASVPSGPSKAVPTAPRSSAAEIASNGDAKKTSNGKATPTAAPSGGSDPKALRARLEEQKSRGGIKHEPKTAPGLPADAARAATPPVEDSKDKLAAATPPAGPRATRSTANLPIAPTGPAGSTRNGPTHTGSSRSISTTAPAAQRTGSMGPPASLSVDEERAAARARKFGVISKPLLPTAPAAKAPSPTPESSRAKTPTSSRKASPTPARTQRSGSVESRASERSRRSRRDEKDREGVRESRETRSRDEDRKELLPQETKPRSITPSERKSSTHETSDRRRQENLLQVRADRLASDEKGETRRSSRDGGHRRETERERDERKARERQRDKGIDRLAKSDESTKRKRDDEAPRHVDDPRDRDRERDKDRRDDRPHRHDARRDDRKDDRRPDRRDDRPDDRRDDRDRRRRERDRDPRDGHDTREIRDTRNGRDTRDTRDPPPHDAVRHRSPERRETRITRSTAAGSTNSDRTPKRDLTPKESAPEKPDARPPNGRGQGDRIIEPPRNMRSSEPAKPELLPNIIAANTPSAVRHALPARPGGGTGRPPTTNLPSRMSTAPTSEQPPNRSPSETKASLPPPDRETSASSDPRKRPLEESAAPAREESPGSSKRVKIDRDKARGHDRKGREAAGQNRLLSNAMKGANE